VAILANRDYTADMRWLAFLFCLALSSAVNASEPYPLWDGHESVADYAKKVNLPPTRTLDLGDGVKMELVLIPAGKFMMGTPKPEKPIVGQTMAGLSAIVAFLIAVAVLLKACKTNRRPQFSLAMMLAISFILSIGVWGAVRWQKALHVNDFNEFPPHEVTLTKPFYMGKIAVTQRQYRELMYLVPEPWRFRDQPMAGVSWDDVHNFCKSMNVQVNAAARLPTEAEWEYACRAGTTTSYYTGESIEDVKQACWCANNSGGAVHPGGLKIANHFGLFDMHGNVWHWCEGWYGSYSRDAAIDPQGPQQGNLKVLRGGCCSSDIEFCRSATRESYDPEFHSDIVGFRIVVDP
jgi:formylglycine-generating enzyme required for sulfatase activity